MDMIEISCERDTNGHYSLLDGIEFDYNSPVVYAIKLRPIGKYISDEEIDTIEHGLMQLKRHMSINFLIGLKGQETLIKRAYIAVMGDLNDAYIASMITKETIDEFYEHLLPKVSFKCNLEIACDYLNVCFNQPQLRFEGMDEK